MNENAADVLKHIADKLDVPVQQLWAGLIAYAPFTFYQWVVGVTVGILAFVAFVPLCYKMIGSEVSKKTDGFVPFLCGAMATVSFVLTSIFGLSSMPDALAAKYAPEAWASKYILRKIGRE